MASRPNYPTIAGRFTVAECTTIREYLLLLIESKRAENQRIQSVPNWTRDPASVTMYRTNKGVASYLKGCVGRLSQRIVSRHARTSPRNIDTTRGGR